jgi:hypothetical protein
VSSVLLDITVYSPFRVNWRFCGTCRLHFQVWRVSQTKNPTRNRQSTLPFSCWFLAWLALVSWRWRRHIPPKRTLILNGLISAISQVIYFF